MAKRTVSGSSVEDGGSESLRALRGSSLALALALVVVMAGLGGSASAAVTGLERFSAPSPDNSSNKSVTVSCPAGKQVLGAGGDIDGGSGEVVMGIVRPNAALTSVTVQGLEDQNGTTANWTATAYAICATPPPGLERVLVPSPTDSLDKSVPATCPAGKRVVGAGGDITGGGGQVALNDIIPNSALTSVTVTGLEDQDGTTSDWSVGAYAICANPVAGRERVAIASATDSSDKNVGAPCPTGKQVTGVGAQLSGGGGQVVLNEVQPNFSLTGAAAIGREDEDDTASNWSVTAFAICANASQRVVAQTLPNSNDKADLVDCPAGTQVTGGGGDITGGSGQVALTAIFPGDAALTNFLALGQEDGDGTTANWFLRIYAICATPLPGLELVSLGFSPGSPVAAALGVACPSGKRVVGVGGEIQGGDGEVVLSSVIPFANLTTGLAAAREDEDGYASDWSLSVYAICATPPPGLEEVIVESDPENSDPASVTARCPAGKNLLGAGAEIVDGFGQVVLDDVRPNALLTSVTVTGLEDQNGFANDWFLRAHAICANP
jgi:hypothetical protein